MLEKGASVPGRDGSPSRPHLLTGNVRQPQAQRIVGMNFGDASEMRPYHVEKAFPLRAVPFFLIRPPSSETHPVLPAKFAQ
jgi:hypothetical protein